jgi:formylglycine-generating enzyme required for sulfatase activity
LATYSHLSEAKSIRDGVTSVAGLKYSKLQESAEKLRNEKKAKNQLEQVVSAMQENAWSQALEICELFLDEFADTPLADSFQNLGGELTLGCSLQRLKELAALENETKVVIERAAVWVSTEDYEEALGLITQRLADDRDSFVSRGIQEGEEFSPGWSLPRVQSHVKQISDANQALEELENGVSAGNIIESFALWQDIITNFGDLKHIQDLQDSGELPSGMSLVDLESSYHQYSEHLDAIAQAEQELDDGRLIEAFEILETLMQRHPEHPLVQELVSGVRMVGQHTFHGLRRGVELLDLQARQEQDVSLARAEITHAQASTISPGAFKKIGGIPFIWCPPCEFMMGIEGPDANTAAGCLRHKVLITKGFWLSATPVTQRQWLKFMGKRRGTFQGFFSGDRPVEMISWNDALTFTKALSDALPESEFRLPTEAEWEYACRAGTETRWFFGESPASLMRFGWIEKNSGKKTHGVRKLKPNPWGLYDLYGNVWEWVQDWDSSKSSDLEIDPCGPKAGAKKLARGGSWFDSHLGTDSMQRTAFLPETRDSIIGMRVVCNT